MWYTFFGETWCAMTPSKPGAGEWQAMWCSMSKRIPMRDFKM
jgi:hypothetical protein